MVASQSLGMGHGRADHDTAVVSDQCESTRLVLNNKY